MRGELLGVYAAEDVGTRDVFIAVVRDQAEREELARAFRVSPATVGRVVTRFNEGGLRAVADHGRHGGRRVSDASAGEAAGGACSIKGLGRARAHQAMAKKASYGTVYAVHAGLAAGSALGKGMLSVVPEPAASQSALAFGGCVAETARDEAASAAAPAPAAVPEESEAEAAEPTLEAVAPARGAVVQHVGSWLLLGMLERMGFYDVAAGERGDVPLTSLRPALDAVRHLAGAGRGLGRGHPAAGDAERGHAAAPPPTASRRAGRGGCCTTSPISANETFPGLMATRLLARTGEGEDRVWLYVDNHLRPYTGKHVIRKGWRMQDKCAVPGDDGLLRARRGGLPRCSGCSTTSHDSLCAWLMPVVEFRGPGAGRGGEAGAGVRHAAVPTRT
ncbi:MAG: helix-turn-helix domain-containing protein [Anaeromyxobacter sp.]